MTVERRQVQLAKCNEDEERLLRRLFRTTHALEIVRARKRRLLKPRPLPPEAQEVRATVSTVNCDPIAAHHQAKMDRQFIQESASMGACDYPPPRKDDNLDPLDFLVEAAEKRAAERKAEIAERDRKLMAMPDPMTKENKAQRRVVEKQVRERELTGKRRKMPPTGKAALDAIRQRSS